MSKFLKRKSSDVTGYAAVIQNMQNLNAGAPVLTNATAAKSLSMESMGSLTQSDSQEIAQAQESLRSMLVQSMVNGAKLTMCQEDAAVVAGTIAFAPTTYLNKSIESAAKLGSMANTNTIVISGFGGLEKRNVDMQAFDERANKNAMVYSMIYNAQASRQDEFGETFFPTVIQTPDQVGYMVSVSLIEVISDIRRDISGSPTNFGRKNIIKAAIDSSILKNDSTKIIPVFRAGVSDSIFSTDVGTRTILTSNGESVVTGALKTGVEFDLLGSSQTAASVTAGLYDVTDAIDSAVKLQAIYAKLANNDVFRFDVANIPTATFNNSIQGNARQLTLNFSGTGLRLTAASVNADGSAMNVTAAGVIGTYSVRLKASVFGNINQQEGTTIVNSAGGLTVTAVLDTAGNNQSLTAGAGAAIVALFTGSAIVGYDLLAYRTNSNRRSRGQLVDNRVMNYLYSVPILPPISAVRPVMNSEDNDAALIQTLVATTRTRASNDALAKVLEVRDFLKEYVSSTNSSTDVPEIFGAARELITPAYLEDNIDCLTDVDSLRSAQRAEDVVGLIVNRIRDFSFRLHQQSGLKAALDTIGGGMASKPLVIIGVDQEIGRYLTILGDTRLVGDHFDHKVVISTNQDMKGKVIITFGATESLTNGVPNPLHFGNMAYMPELTLVIPTSRNGAQLQELSVQPRYLHVANLPVMGVINVSNIDKVIADKVTFNTHAIP